MIKTPNPIPACVNEMLHYDKLTGSFTWIHKFKTKPWLTGSPAGYTHSWGYRIIGINSVDYNASRIAWFMTYGEQPNFIDHINGVRSDDRIINIRNVTALENSHNHGKSFNGSGLPCGVSMSPAGTFRARLMCEKKQVRIGHFKTAHEAHNAYLEKRKELFGEFSREVL